MNPQALIVAYYLSRFNNDAYLALGFPGRQKTKAHEHLGQALSVNSNSLKLRRDDFDPLHGHRAGWHEYKLSEKMHNVVEACQDLDFSEMTDVVLEIISSQSVATDIGVSISEVNKSDKTKKRAEFVPRGITGEKAELYFKEWYLKNHLPIKGKIIDKRHDGCGYDFLLEGDDDKNVFIEVKGLDQKEGGATFTSKEWEVAKESGDSYYLALVSNLSSDPILNIMQNPFSRLSAKKYIYQPIQVKWNVSSADLRSFIGKQE